MMPGNTIPVDLRDRIQQCTREWRLTLEESFETETSVISFVRRAGESLVLKVVKHQCDEWNAGDALNAFDGRGVVRVFEHTGGAMLIERLQPGNSLFLNLNDEEATGILAGVIEQMSPREAPDGFPTVADWGKGFDRYLATNDGRIPRKLVESAQQVFADLGKSQRRPRLLHGDLQHYNVLFDANRGWLAIDPKGVIGELEYEIGAVLRNPIERSDLFLAPAIIERRLNQFSSRLGLNSERTLAWAFAQAVLSAIWQLEDGFKVDVMNSALRLASAIQPMLT